MNIKEKIMNELSLDEIKIVSGGHTPSVNTILNSNGPGADHVQAAAPAEAMMSEHRLPHQAGGNPLHAGGN